MRAPFSFSAPPHMMAQCSVPLLKCVIVITDFRIPHCTHPFSSSSSSAKVHDAPILYNGQACVSSSFFAEMLGKYFVIHLSDCLDNTRSFFSFVKESGGFAASACGGRHNSIPVSSDSET